MMEDVHDNLFGKLPLLKQLGSHLIVGNTKDLSFCLAKALMIRRHIIYDLQEFLVKVSIKNDLPHIMNES